MLTIICFLLTIIGSVNWLLIGLLQYDFVAGIFGYQASVFSRIIYIIIGISSAILIYKLIKGKGVISVFSRNNKKDLKKNLDKMLEKSKDTTPSYQNVEAGHDIYSEQDYPNDVHYNHNRTNVARRPSDGYDDGQSLFDEYLDDDNRFR